MAEIIGACTFLQASEVFRVTAGRVCMYFHGSAVAGNSKLLKRDQSIINRRKDSGERKNGLEDVLFSIREGLTTKDVLHHIPCGISIRLRFNKSSIGTDHFLGFYRSYFQ